MPFKLQCTEASLGVSFNSRYENMARNKKPEIVAKTANGTIVKERITYKNDVLVPGSTQRRWVDDNGAFYNKSELTFYYEGEAVPENTQTKVFEIEGFQPLSNYTDTYVISAYYELFPDDNGMKKDHDRDIARRANLCQMRKLWDHLDKNQLVARGEFCPSSRGFISSDGYIRAIKINGNKWGLEIGVFSQEKIFQHLNEGIPTQVVKPATKKLKRI